MAGVVGWCVTPVGSSKRPDPHGIQPRAEPEKPASRGDVFWKPLLGPGAGTRELVTGQQMGILASASLLLNFFQCLQRLMARGEHCSGRAEQRCSIGNVVL